MQELEKIKDIFLADEDPETVEENRQQIAVWELSIIENQAFVDWQDHDITKRLSKQVRQTYVDVAVQLSQNRNLTTAEREKLWAKQDAMLYILSLTEKDAKGELEQINAEIRRALNATNQL